MDWHKLFEYRDGALYWRANPTAPREWNTRRAGKRAGTVHTAGYRQISIKKRHYYAHRIIWGMHHGPIPAGMEVDHRSTNKADDRIENLRLATSRQNKVNARCRRNNKAGFKGVIRHRDGKRFRADICIAGKNKYLGLFNTAEEAHAAYCKAARLQHGEFFRAS